MRKMIVMMVLLFVAATMHAADKSAEMRKLDFMLGEWSGDSWIQMGPGKPARSVVTEVARSKAGVVVIEGVGRRKNEDGSIGDVVHDAIGIISWDPVRKAYAFAAYTESKGHVDASFALGENNSVVWSFEAGPGQKIRYTIHVSEKGEWNEVGEFSSDGEKWLKFFEMNLKKKM